MARKKKEPTAGRPKEYEGDMRTVTTSFPISLIERLDKAAEKAGVSRQRLMMEWLRICTTLEAMDHLESSSIGTVFHQHPPGTSMTNKELAEWAAEAAKENPDGRGGGFSFMVTRDKKSNDEFMKRVLEAAAEVERMKKERQNKTEK